MSTEKKFYSKLFDLRKEVGKISRDSKNPFFHSQYFDINKLLEHLQPLLEEHKLLLTQPINNNEVYSIITDVESGDEYSSCLKLPELSDPQKIGSAITYYRRYTLASLLALQSEDDDGNNASKPHVNGTSKKNKKPGKVPDDEKDWLNEGTKDWENAEKKVYNGSIKAHDLRDFYKVSNANMEFFEAIEKKRQSELDEQFDKEKLEGTPF